MWKFHELPYQRPDVEAIRAEYVAWTEKLEAASDYPAAREAYLALDGILIRFSGVITIAQIRNTMDTRDAFYTAEMEFLNAEGARFSPLQKRASEAVLKSPFRAEFEAEYGEYGLKKLELQIKTQDEAIVEDLIAESELCEAYKDTVAGCQTDFMGESVNFYGLLKSMENPDRAVRRAALEVWAGLYEGVSAQLDEFYGKLIAVRLRMAEKLGFASYTELAYANMGRTDYTAADAAAFRAQVLEVIVPAVARYRQAQAARIGVDKLRYYDESYMFPDGNADPVGSEADLIEAARTMYRAMSKETGEFFDFMIEHDLFDLGTRPGKHLGGYCTALFDVKAPFIFSNFNGTAADFGVLTHEAGHAFAAYTASREQPLSDYYFTTAEAAEIHSMTMEHFAYPWMELFFGKENVRKAKFTHLSEALMSIPYLVAVDEFQCRIYEKPDMTAAERRTVWRGIEKAYMPWRDYDGLAFLEEGGFWMQKQHIFLNPFYYVDYALAQVSAFELYGRMKESREAAWVDYLALCKAGGSRSYFGLLSLGKLANPFEAGSVQRAVGHVIAELDGASNAL